MLGEFTLLIVAICLACFATALGDATACESEILHVIDNVSKTDDNLKDPLHLNMLMKAGVWPVIPFPKLDFTIQSWIWGLDVSQRQITDELKQSRRKLRITDELHRHQKNCLFLGGLCAFV